MASIWSAVCSQFWPTFFKWDMRLTHLFMSSLLLHITQLTSRDYLFSHCSPDPTCLTLWFYLLFYFSLPLPLTWMFMSMSVLNESHNACLFLFSWLYLEKTRKGEVRWEDKASGHDARQRRWILNPGEDTVAGYAAHFLPIHLLERSMRCGIF